MIGHRKLLSEQHWVCPYFYTPVKTAAAVLSDVAADYLYLDSEYVAEVFVNLSRKARKPFHLIDKEVLLGLFRWHKKK